MARSLAIVAFTLGLALLARGQMQDTTSVNHFTFPMPQFQSGILEATQRLQDNYTGFVYSFANATASDQTPNGMLQPNQVNTNPFLSTLPGDGNGQTLVTLGPCASNTPHTHPRGSEISTLLYGGPIQFGMVEENSGNANQLVIRNHSQYETVHVPTGIMHFSHNPTCQPAAFLANFATKDPGTQTIWRSLTMIPNDILNAATGISEGNWTSLKMNYPLLTAPGTGSTECLQRCGLDFMMSNKLTPVTNPSLTVSSLMSSMSMAPSTMTTMTAAAPAMSAGKRLS